LSGNAHSTDAFCSLYDTCSQEAYSDDYEANDDVDCESLTSCEWEGKKEEFVGDGVCDQYTKGCYNTEVCGYDQGDCCEDQCTSGTQAWAECGSNGYYCADPGSEKCDPSYNSACPPLPTPPPPVVPTCSSSETLIKIMQYDSWGDGWNNAEMTFKAEASSSSSSAIYEGSLEDGAEGTIYECVQNGCYVMAVTGGDWGNEISWEVRPSNGGSLLAMGGAPEECHFPVGGNQCANTCQGGAEPEPIDPGHVDPDDGDDAAEQVQCMMSHCAIQYADCVSDFMNCLPCLSDYTQSYCVTNGKFEALTRCEQCYCVEGMESSCDGDGDGGGGGPPTCSGTQIGLGGQAVVEWQTCTGIGDAANLITDWNEDNFGSLDQFERCSHQYTNDANHGGHKAEDCMQILFDSANSKNSDIITDIASELYWKPGKMCGCSSDAWTGVPTCNTFSRFKVLVHETLDACNSLDEIDCDAWKEFSDKCQVNVMQEYGVIDFYKRKQCDYVKEGCGNSGAFPAFRKLDCGGEIPKKNWDFWNLYSTGCALAAESDDDYVPPEPNPTPTPPTPTPPTPTPPTPTPPAPVDPSDGPDAGEHKGGATGPVFGVLGALGVVVGGAVVYKKKRDANAMSSAYRYRPQRDSDSFADSTELFSGMTVNAGSFKPPSIPQTHNI
jgi:hypothetical protein